MPGRRWVRDCSVDADVPERRSRRRGRARSQRCGENVGTHYSLDRLGSPHFERWTVGFETRSATGLMHGVPSHAHAKSTADLDSHLLHEAMKEGARVLTAEVRDIRRSPAGGPVVGFRLMTEEPSREIEADSVAFAAGVNRTPRMNEGSDPLVSALAKVMPGSCPPKVRKAVIREMQAQEHLLGSMAGEMYSIRIKTDAAAILRQLGEFGGPEREYFTPRFIRVRRTAGEPNVVGGAIRYEVIPSAFVHDVLWNHSLYRIGHLAEHDETPKRLRPPNDSSNRRLL